MSDFSNSASPYDQTFYNNLRPGSQRSAQVIVPLLLDWIHPESVIDVGCGDGTWLSVFQAFGVKTIHGIDGNYVEPHTLRIPPESFTATDLKNPWNESRSFDLVVCLEVAEHLPSNCAKPLVQSLTQLGPVIVFSAAIPYQGGTEHINEQWPAYWVQLFDELGYIPIDALRPVIWDISDIEPWYAQNSLIFIQQDRISQYPKLQAVSTVQPLNLVHPKIYLQNFTHQVLSQDIQISEISLHPGSDITAGSGLAITIYYRCYSPISSAIFGISISNADDVICLDTHSNEISLHSDNSQALQRIDLNISRLDLTQGHYFINVGIYSSDWETTYDFHWQKYTLNILHTEDGSGILNPPLEWQTPQ